MDKTWKLKRTNNVSHHIQCLTRYNAIYNDPKKLLENYLNKSISLNEICKKCLKGEISSEFRGILYKIFLHLLPYNETKDNWINNVKNTRQTYITYKEELIESNQFVLDFIRCEDKKGSEQYNVFIEKLSQQECELLDLIKLDVDRTFQELDLFHNKTIKEMLIQILYIYSKKHTEPSYCQGMNEILGTLLYALLPSVTVNNMNSKKQKTNIDILYEEITTDEYFEADLFTIYEELMSRDLRELYAYNEARFRNNKVTINKESLTEEELQNYDISELSKRINRIFYIFLKKVDEKLCDYLRDKVEPNIFLFRWILCMLNREISLKNVIWLWDCILAYEFIEFTVNTVEIDKTRLNYLDYICLGMIIDLKDKLYEEEEGSLLLMNFLQYPNEKNITNVCKLAEEISIKLNEKNLWEDSHLLG